MTLELRYIPDPILKKISTPVEKIDKKLLDFLNQMLETMYVKDGIGLAGVQVGFPKRVLVVDVRDKDIEIEDVDKDDERRKNPRFFINPKIVWRSENKTPLKEGCLSVPEQRGIVTRPQKIKVEYQNRKGEMKTLEADGLLSKCIQHEIDHLNGRLYIDYLSKLKKDMAVSRVKKLQKAEKVE